MLTSSATHEVVALDLGPSPLAFPLALLLLITSFCTLEDKDVLPPLTMVAKEIYEATASQRKKMKLAMNPLSFSPFHIKKPHTLTFLWIKETCEENIKAFSTAIASGALPQLKGLQLGLGGKN